MLACRTAVRRTLPGRRSGSVLVFSVFLMICLLAALALAVDLGYLMTVRTQAQRTADAAALAGAASLYHPAGSLEEVVYHLPPEPQDARITARSFVRKNHAGGRSVDVMLNETNIPTGDIVVGRLNRPADRSELLDATAELPNTVHVSVPLVEGHANGTVGLFFARALGVQTTGIRTSSSATVWYPALLPFATSIENWQSLDQGGTGDEFTYRPGAGDFGVIGGPDGVREIIMFPGDWTEGDLPPGNFGVIQIGPDGLVLEALRRQVDMGPSVSDMELHGGEIWAGDQLEGLTGLKSATKHAILGGSVDGRQFSGMLGRPRRLPLYSEATGNGANSVFTIARFVGVRIMAIRMGGRWRTSYLDTEGDEIEAIMVQPLTRSADLVQVQLTR